MDEQAGQERTTVFLSYTRTDQPSALPIIALIESLGYNVWWDGMIEGGTSYRETTEEALESAQAVVVLWSENSIKSHWVRDEATSGLERGRMVPLKLDGTMAPLGFRQVQLIDFSKWRQNPKAAEAQELARVLSGLHGREDAPAPASAIRKPASRPLSRRALMIGAGSLGIGIAGGLAIKQLWSESKGFSLAENSLAVLPFGNVGNDPENTYLASGLSSEIRLELARNQSLRVVAASSSEAVARQGLSAKEISETLGVGLILEGAVRKVKDELTVTATLIDGQTGFSRWSEDFTGANENLLVIRQAIIEALVSTLTSTQDADGFDPKDGGTQNPAAFNAFLKATDLYLENTSRDSSLNALGHLSTALSLDPNFGNAQALKAKILLLLAVTSQDTQSMSDFLQESLSAAETAVRLAPNSPETHSTLAHVRLNGFLDIAGAREPYETSRELGKGLSTVMARYAVYMAVVGRDQDALSAINQAVILDPLNPTMFNTAGFVHYAGARYEQAISNYERVLELSPGFTNAEASIGLSLIRLGRTEDGLARCSVEANPLERLTCEAIGYQRIGREGTAQQAMDELIRIYGEAGAYQQVQVLAEWGDPDAAMTVMEKAVELRDTGLTLAQFDPALDSLRGREDFSKLLAKLGF